MIDKSHVDMDVEHSALEADLYETLNELKISPEEQKALNSFLAPLRDKSPVTRPHHEHSIRVALSARRIARFMHLDERALLYAGLMHDIGKTEVCLGTLGKIEGWTEVDTEEVKRHVMSGYYFLKGRFDFTAEVILWHHRFQRDGYPKTLPPPLHDYSESTKALIPIYGRVLALADVYDALHRVNAKFGELKKLSGQEIKDQMLALNLDQQELIESLYRADIFTVAETIDDELAEEREDLYDQAWSYQKLFRNPRETGRLIMLAVALEPLADKSGCTTRYTNISRHLKLEYFITGAINIGEAFEELARLVEACVTQPPSVYEFALRAQCESKRNRAGGRINQGIIELLMPIVVAQHRYDLSFNLSAEEIIIKVGDVLKQTTPQDVLKLREMKRYAYDLSGYIDRDVSEYRGTQTVYEYYEREFDISIKPTSIAHNGEFIHGFPTVGIIYQTLRVSKLPGLTNRMEQAYRRARLIHPTEVGSGFIADCIAVGTYLYLSQHPKIKLVT
ncbi:HD domain-containing protein [Candidatus Jorgensenbacteria bacterium]|nr:HD domain-containing protein [Candidatus Jorgensenbacteria bacterium]